MPSLIEELRSALNFEMILNGSFVPLGKSFQLVSHRADTMEGDDHFRTGAAPIPKTRRQESRAAMPAPEAPPQISAAPDRSPYDRIAGLIPPQSPIRAIDSLDALKAYVSETILIPLDESRINPVFGVGNPEADLMIIGEAPGAEEDKRGEPFVGRAGQLLNKILESVQFHRDDVYICNILKSRPPKNRDPLPAEVAAHIPLLYRQITLVRPKILLAVGRTAGNGLLGKVASLSSLRGKFHDYHGLPLMVTYHPAALLRNQQWKRPTWEDVKLLRKRFDELSNRSDTSF